MMRRAASFGPAPSDAAPLIALLMRDELAALEAERQRLTKVIASLKPRRSTIVETRLKQLTRRMLEIRVAIARGTR